MSIKAFGRIFVLCLYTVSCSAMEVEDFTYARACDADVDQLHRLIDEARATQANERLVFLPTMFQRATLKNQIAQGRLFVAKDGDNTVIGFKKLFVITDQQEQHEILTGEIRSHGSNAKQLYSGFYNPTFELRETEHTPDYSENTTYVYNGGDFTHPDFRQKGVNRALMQKALELVRKDTVDKVQIKKSTHLALVYGLVNQTAGINERGEEKPGSETDRTSSIVKCFAPFAREVHQEVYGSSESQSIGYYRYKAFKPSFDSDSQKCVPKPDQFSVEARGCVLLYPLAQEDNE